MTQSRKLCYSGQFFLGAITVRYSKNYKSFTKKTPFLLIVDI